MAKQDEAGSLPAPILMQFVLDCSLEKRVPQLVTNLPSKQTFPLVQLGIQCDYLMNTILSAACAVAVVI